MHSARLRTLAAWVLAPLFLALAALPAFAADTDGDGLEDAFETAVGTNPAASDTDGDSWNDYYELFVAGTDPTQEDTDGDGVADASDSDPLAFPAGDADGVADAARTGARTGTPWARSGLSPADGAGVLVHDGSVHYRCSVGRAKGINGLDFSLDLHYDSRSAWDGSHGFGWTSNLEARRTVSQSGDVTLLWDGVEGTWTWNGSGWTPPTGFVATMTQPTSGTYAVTWPDGRSITVDASGLRSVSDRWGNTIACSWSGGRMTSVTDSRGQTHALGWYATGRLASLTTADGAAWTFGYNVRGQLHRIAGPAVTGFPDGITWEFRYVNGSSVSALNGSLVGAADGRGQWWLRCEYDTQDRVTRQTVGDGTAHYDFAYSTSSSATTVTDRAGNERVWTWDATKLTKASLVERTNRNVRSGEGDYTTAWTTDSDGFLVAETLPRGNGTKWTLNAAKLPTEVRRKADMSAADSSSDAVDTYAYDSSKFYGTTSHTDAEGHTTSYSLSTYGQPTTVTFPTLTHVSPSVTFTNACTYNSDGTTASFTDGEGKRTTYAYYTTGARKGRLQTRTVDADSLALQTTWDWTDWGDLKSETDPRGNTTTWTVQRYGNVTKVQSPSALGYETRYVHDGNLNVVVRSVKNVSETGTWLSSPQWWITRYDYTVMDRPSSIVEDVTSTTTRTTALEYDANDNLAKVIRAGRETRYAHDERDLLWKRTLEGGSSADLSETWDYDGNRNRVLYLSRTVKGSNDGFDGLDRHVRHTDTLGNYADMSYDKTGRLTQTLSYREAGATDELVAGHRNTYDAMGRRWKEEDALIGSSSTTWYARTYGLDGRGLVTSVTDRLGHTTTFAYDGAGRRTSATDAVGNVSSWTFDGAGNVTAVQEAEKIPGSSATETYRTEFTYDALNRRTKRSVVDRNDSQVKHVTEWKLSALGLAKTIDPLGNETTLTLDGLGRTTQRSVALGTSSAIVTQWTRDDFDAVTRVRDDAGNDTDYAYDVFGRLQTKSFASGKTVAYQHDANGNVTRITDEDGTVIVQTFDDADRLTARDVTPATGVGGDTTERFTYDALGRLTEAKDDDSIVQLAWDSLGRLVTETQGPNPLGSSGKTVTYSTDAEGRRTEVAYPSGFEAHETRDALGRLTAIEDQGQTAVASFALYGAGSRRKDATLPNGSRTYWTHDGFRRPTDIAHETSGSTEFAGFTYAFDAADDPLMEARSHASGKGDVHAYDAARRLVKTLRDVDDPAAELASPGSEAYDRKLEFLLDDRSNVTRFDETPYQGSTASTSYTLDSMDRVTAVGSQSVTWTDSGSLKDDGTFEYVYDAHHRLVQVKRKSDASTVATYAYDCLGRGRRIAKTVGSATTRLVHAGDAVIEEYDGSGSLARLFVLGEGPRDVVMMEAPDAADVDGDSNTSEVLRFSFHAQIAGSVTQVTGPSQSVVESYVYEPFGAPTILDGSGSALSASAIGNPWTFRGFRLDAETGLYDDGTRLWSPALRRYLQRDPDEPEDALNPYALRGVSPVGADLAPAVPSPGVAR